MSKWSQSSHAAPSKSFLPLLSGAANNVLYENPQARVLTGHLQRPHFNQVCEPALQPRLNRELQGRGQLLAVRLKNHSQQATAKIRPVHSLAGTRKKKFFDHVADMVVVVGGRRSAAAIEMERKVDIHQLPLTRS